MLNVSNTALLLERISQSLDGPTWQNHKQQALLDMLAELPKWAKMADARTPIKVQPAATIAATSSANPLSDGATAGSSGAADPSSARSAPSAVAADTAASHQSAGGPAGPPPAPAAAATAPADPWDMTHFLRELEALAKAPIALVSKSPAKEGGVKRSLFGLLPYNW